MNYERLLIGLGLLIMASVAYYFIKDEKPSSEKNGFTGPTLSTFIGIRMCVVLAVLAGLGYIIGSLPAHI